MSVSLVLLKNYSHMHDAWFFTSLPERGAVGTIAVRPLSATNVREISKHPITAQQSRGFVSIDEIQQV